MDRCSQCEISHRNRVEMESDVKHNRQAGPEWLRQPPANWVSMCRFMFTDAERLMGGQHSVIGQL